MSDRPHVVVAFADQWRYSAVGYAGDPNVRTPHLDELAAESLNLTHAVSSCPVCSPARASLITGQYPDRHGVYINDPPLEPSGPCVAEVFKDHGYDTAYVGKWHIDGPARSGYIPPRRRRGFDHWAVLNCTHRYNQSHYYLGDSDQLLTWPGYDAYCQTDHACNVLAQRKRGDKPMLMFLSWGPPHDPYDQAPPEQLARYDPAKIQLQPNVPADHHVAARKYLRGYYAHVSALDDCVARLRQSVRQHLGDNTILVVTSDHGDMLESHGHFNKQRPWEESLRIPMLINWPAAWGREGRRLNTMVSFQDLMPTLLSMAGLPIPESVQTCDFADHLLRGGDDPSRGIAYYACYAPFGLWTRRFGGRECRGIRTHRYTYVRDLSGPWLMYDNDHDPYQMRNLIGDRAYAIMQDQLDVTLRNRMAEIGDEFLPAREYNARWGYQVDPVTETLPYH